MINIKNFTYGKQEANAVKAVAILMMVFHHLFGFPEWVDSNNMFLDFSIGNHQFFNTLATYCKICVSLFMFSTGYSLAINENQTTNYRSVFKKAFSFLRKYWCIFAITLIVGLILQEPFPNIKTIILQAFGLFTGTGYGMNNITIHCNFAWYVTTYLLFIFLFPILKKLCRYNAFIDIVVFFIIIYCGLGVIINYVGSNSFFSQVFDRFRIYCPIGLIGYIFNKHDIFYRVNKYFETLNKPKQIVSLILFCFSSFALRTTYPYMEIDIILSPILVFAISKISCLINSKCLNNLCNILSKHSINIWFLHSLFFTPNKTLQSIAYFPKYPIIIFIWVILLCIAASIAIEFIKHILIKIIQKFRYFLYH